MPLPINRLPKKAPAVPYVFQEYPKWVSAEDGQAAVVQDAEEELAFLTAHTPQSATKKAK